MSKLAHQRAYEQYPQGNDGSSARIGYTLGYDQAFQDFLEKAENAISMISRHYIGEDYSFEQVWEQFKNYMEDEN